MRAVRIREPGGPEVLEVVDRPEPEPGPGEVRIRVRSAGVNRADILQRMGRYPVPPGSPADVPGLEFAGEIAALGPGVEGWSEGDRVMGILGGGGYAEYAVVPVEQLLPAPTGFSWAEAGAIPEVFLTATDALFLRAVLREGERVLIHAAGGGVGTAAIQLARAGGARWVGGTASAGKLERIREAELPLDAGIDYRSESFAEVVREATDGEGVDVILDTVGAPYWADNVASLATLGRIVVVGVLGGSVTQVDLRQLMGRRASVIGTVLRARSAEEKGLLTREFSDRCLGGFERGDGDRPLLRPVVDRVFALEGAAEAHRYVESNASFGKVLLSLDAWHPRGSGAGEAVEEGEIQAVLPRHRQAAQPPEPAPGRQPDPSAQIQDGQRSRLGPEGPERPPRDRCQQVLDEHGGLPHRVHTQLRERPRSEVDPVADGEHRRFDGGAKTRVDGDPSVPSEGEADAGEPPRRHEPRGRDDLVRLEASRVRQDGQPVSGSLDRTRAETRPQRDAPAQIPG